MADSMNNTMDTNKSNILWASMDNYNKNEHNITVTITTSAGWYFVPFYATDISVFTIKVHTRPPGDPSRPKSFTGQN